MQIDPIKPKLNPPGTNVLTLKYDEPLSNFAFKFNLRRYIEGWSKQHAIIFPALTRQFPDLFPEHHFRMSQWAWAGAYTRPLLSSI